MGLQFLTVATLKNFLPLQLFATISSSLSVRQSSAFCEKVSLIDSLLVALCNYIGLRLNLNQCGCNQCNHYKEQIEFLTNFAVVWSRQAPPGGGLIGSKSYNLQRRDRGAD